MKVAIIQCHGQIGSGSLPVENLESVALTIRPAGRPSGGKLKRLAASFRALPVPVLGRISENALNFDLRCLEEETVWTTQLSELQVDRP